MPGNESQRLVRSFHVSYKPNGSICNIDCAYCYYLHKQDLLQSRTPKSPNSNQLEEFVRQYMSGQDVDAVTFTWHGGEPTLSGLDFYRAVVRYQSKYANGRVVKNDIQTNGLLLDEEWCEFIKEHAFLVGLSIDGPKSLHDRFRLGRNGSPTFDLTVRAASLLQRFEIPFNTLTVVNAVNARHPTEVYQFLTEELGSRYLQWLPCVEPKDFKSVAPGMWNGETMPALGSASARPNSQDSIVTSWSVDPDDWGEFLCRTFDLWYQNDVGKVFVNWFESLLGRFFNKPAQLCTMAEVCGRAVAVERDGSVYSCDHFVYPEYKLGVIQDDGPQLVDLVFSPTQRKFGCNKRDTLTDYCKRCEVRFACNGDCPKNRFIKSPDGQPGLSYLCSGFKRFFNYSDPYLRQLVAKLKAEAEVASPR